MFLRFWRDIGGNIAPIFAIASIPLVSATGAAVDYSQAFRERTIVQDALDSAALAGGKKIGVVSNDAVIAEAQSFFASNVATEIDPVPTLTPNISGATITLTTTLDVPTHFLGIVGIDELSFDLKSQVTQGIGTVEVALVLDTSGSMNGSKLTSLKSSANSLVTTLFNLASTSTKPDPIKVAIVPFSGAVNVGSSHQNDGWIDTSAIGTYHADAMENAGATAGTSNFTLFSALKDSGGNAISWGGCVEQRPIPYDAQDDAASNANTMFVPMFAADEPDNWTCSTGSCAYAGSSSSTRRYNGAPTGAQSYNNYLPDDGNATTCSADFNTLTVTAASPAVVTKTSHGLTAGTPIVFSTTGSLPSGLTAGIPYYVISTGLSTNSFRVSTSSGGSAVNTSGSQSGTHSYNKSVNFTCSNGNSNCDGTSGKSETIAFAGSSLSTSKLCKYGSGSNKGTVASITFGSGATAVPGGPNFLCNSTAITPLTKTKATVTTAINNLVALGATSIDAGLAWGWRVLSPALPFTEGRAYTEEGNKKIIILMTDGENTYYPNSKLLKSWYGDWGYVARSHMGSNSTDATVLSGLMNDRTKAACANAKAAPNNVIIYTVGFDINAGTVSNPSAALDLLQKCASDSTKYFNASDSAALSAAFTAIGNSITELRIEK
ncbi:MAG: pilus assembly protein [Bauldia sp.]